MVYPVSKMTVNERLDRHDKEIAAIRKLVLTGMRMLVKSGEGQMAMRKDLRELAAAQKRTEEKLQMLIDTLRRGSNGHSKKPANLQSIGPVP